jgi:hypothetical protein
MGKCNALYMDSLEQDSRVYIEVNGIECECDLSLEPNNTGEIPVVILQGNLMGFEMLLATDFIRRKVQQKESM